MNGNKNTSRAHEKNKCAQNSLWRKFLQSLLLLIIIETAFGAKQGVTRFEGMRTCTKKSGAYIGSFQIYNSTTHKTKTVGLVEAELQIIKDLAPALPGTISVSRCSGSSGHDCNPLLKYNHKDICSILSSKGSLWSNFMDRINPRVLCPIKKGDYKIRNGTFDGERFSSYFQGVPGQQNKVTFYKVKMDSVVDEEHMICVDVTFRTTQN